MVKNYARAYPRFWLAYFVASVLLAGLSIVAELSAALNGRSSLLGLLGLAFGMVALLPLYGYVRQRKVGKRWVWWIVLAISTLMTGMNGLILLRLLSHIGLALPLLGAVLALAFVMPHLFAIYHYVRHSAHIWHAAG